MATAKRKLEKKTLFAAGTVLAYHLDGTLQLAVTSSDVAVSDKEVKATALIVTNKCNRFTLGDEVAFPVKADLKEVKATKRGKHFEISKKDRPQEESKPSSPAKRKDSADEESEPEKVPKARSKSVPVKASKKPQVKKAKARRVAQASEEEASEPEETPRKGRGKSQKTAVQQGEKPAARRGAKKAPVQGKKSKGRTAAKLSETEESDNEAPRKGKSRPAAHKKVEESDDSAPAKKPSRPAKKPSGGSPKPAARQKSKKPLAESESEDLPPPRKRGAKQPASDASDYESSEDVKPKKPGKKKKLLDVQRIDRNEELAAEESALQGKCCVACTDRNVVRVGLTTNLQLWKSIKTSDKEISSLQKWHGPDMKKTGLFYACQAQAEELVRALIAEAQDPKIKYGYRPEPALAFVGTGQVSREAFGVQVRQVNMSRGGREGNNALLYPEYLDQDLSKVVVKLVKRGISTDFLNLLFTLCPACDQWLSNSVGDAVRTGDLALALHMVQIYNKKGGFGFNFLHEAVLKKGKLPEFKKVSITKKVLGNSCIAPLHCACINPDASHLREMLPLVDNIGYEDFDKWKAVHYAAVCASAEPMKALCEHGVNINDVTKDKTTPLMLAAKRNRAEVVEFLLKKGANVDMKNRKGKAALHYAAQYGAMDALKVLFKHQSKKTLEQPGPEKMTPLIVAATKGHAKAVEALLEQGANVKKRDKLRRTALLQAVKNGHADIASVLLAHGADPNDPDSSKNAPLHYCCAYGWWQCTDLLLGCGADINAANDWKLPPLLVALLKGHFGLVKHLLEVPGVDVNCKDEEGRTLLSRSVDMLSASTLEQMEDLLQHRHADPNLPDLQGLTPLHHLAHRSKPIFPGLADTPKEEQERYIEQQWALQEQAAALLLNYAANINAESQDKQTPVQLALLSRNARMCKFLLQKGAAVGLTAKDGSTLLHATAAFDADLFPIVRDLLQVPEIRATVNAVDDEGFTPLLSFCRKFQLEASNMHIQIEAIIRAEMLEIEKKKPKPEGENAFLAGLQAGSSPQQVFPGISGKTVSPPAQTFLFAGKPACKTTGGLFGGARTKQTARLAYNPRYNSYNQSSTAVSYVIDEVELQRRVKAEFDSLADSFADLLGFLIQSGADPRAHVEKLKKYRDDPQVIKIEYEENKSKQAVLQAQQGQFLFGQQVAPTITYFITDFDGTTRWKEYGDQGLKSPLHFLLGYPHEALVEKALQLGLDLNQRDFEGETALHVLCIPAFNMTLVEKALNAGASPNICNCKGETALHRACGSKSAALVQQLLLHGAQAEILDAAGTFPLKISVEGKDSATVHVLLEHGVNPNFCDGKKRTALHHAFNSADVSADASFDLEAMLLEAGADINRTDVRNRTPLHYAFVKIGNPDLSATIDPVETVSSACSMKGVNPNVKDAWGRTALHYAAQRGSVTSAMIMIEAGGDVSLQDSVGNTPLGVALANGHSEFATMLLQHKLDISLPVIVAPKVKEIQQSLFNNYDPNDYSFNMYGQRKNPGTPAGPLSVGTFSTFRAAVKQNWLGVAYLLLYRGYDYMRAMQDAMNEQKFQLCLTLLAKVTDSSVVRQSNEMHQNLFHTLALYGVAAAPQVTQALGAKLNLRKVDWAQKDVDGKQPLHIACASQYPALISFLLNLGAQSNETDTAGRTALVHAIENKRVLTSLPTLQVLSSADFNVKFTNEDSLVVTPIIHAVMQSASKEVVVFMLKAGADIAATDGEGRNLLMHAIRKNNFPLVEAILGFAGLDMHMKDGKGWTYVHHVVCPLDFGSYENAEILDKLVASGVDLSLPDNEGHTPYYYACKQRSGLIKAELERLGVEEESSEPTVEEVFEPESTVDYASDFEEYLKAKAESMEVEESAKPDPAGDFPQYYEVVDNFDALMVRVDLAYGPFSAYLFYRMQLLRDRNRDVYVLFTRWGRIGETGAYQRTPFSTREEGEAEYRKVFREKTKNDWGSEFKHVKGKYRLLTLSNKRVEHKQFLQLFDFVKAPPARVSTEVQGALKQLTDSNVYTSVFSSTQIDVGVLNFSNIGKSDLLQAEELLCEIGSILQKIRVAKTNEAILDYKEQLYDLSSRFYEIIPMTSFLHTAIVPIQQEHELKARLDMLATLRNVEVASKIILGALYRQDAVNPYDYCYLSLQMEMVPLQPLSSEFKLLQLYAENGGNTQKIVNIFRVRRSEETRRIQKHASIKQRLLLWHGTSLSNLLGIFTQGLKIAPPEAPATGYMFGKGVYFADFFSKSQQYCSNNYGLGSKTNLFILLAEVVVGKSLEKYQGENIEKLPSGHHSVKALGREGPDYSQSVILEDGVTVPCGPHMQYPQPEPGTYLYLQHNEYIVYHVSQVRLRYLLELKTLA